MSETLKKLQAAFDNATRQVIFKGNAVEEIQRIALQTIQSLEASYSKQWQQREAAEDALAKMRERFDTEHLAHLQAIREIEALDDKCDAIIAKGNQARKHAAARANRYKTKYDQLLETLEALLPGAKALLTARAIPQAEKVKRLAALEKQIAQQKKRIQEKVEYDPQRYRDVYRPGYGQQCRLLKALLDRKHTLENQKSY